MTVIDELPDAANEPELEEGYLTAIELAVDICGGQRQLGELVGVTQSFVSQWVKNRRPIPPVRCRKIQKATANLVTVYDLRPDVFGPPPADEERVICTPIQQS